jgi:hypothetical protein
MSDQMIQVIESPYVRIHFESPLTEFTESFFVPGQPRHQHPRIGTIRAFQDFSTPSVASFGSPLPLIYMRCGVVTFDIGTWGGNNSSPEAMFHQAARRMLGYPALIPATSIDLGPAMMVEGSELFGVRLRAKYGGKLYLAATFTPGQYGQAKIARPIVCRPSRALAGYLSWQPLLIAMTKVPTDGNFAFISRTDNGWLQTKTDAVGVDVTFLRESRLHPAALAEAI